MVLRMTFTDLLTRVRAKANRPLLTLLEQPRDPRIGPDELVAAARDVEAALRLLRMRRRRFVRKLEAARSQNDVRELIAVEPAEGEARRHG